jgi:hypothetical protein
MSDNENKITEFKVPDIPDELPAEVIDTFTIPDEMAKDLSDCLTKSSIRRSMLSDLVGSETKFNELEKTIIPLENRIGAMKTKITNFYVPEKYRSQKYQWTFPGYEVSGNVIWIQLS